MFLVFLLIIGNNNNINTVAELSSKQNPYLFNTVFISSKTAQHLNLFTDGNL